jgi:hypothetical protein
MENTFTRVKSFMKLEGRSMVQLLLGALLVAGSVAAVPAGSVEKDVVYKTTDEGTCLVLIQVVTLERKGSKVNTDYDRLEYTLSHSTFISNQGIRICRIFEMHMVPFY